MAAEVEAEDGIFPIKIAWTGAPGEMVKSIQVTLDPRRLFYGFTNRKEIEVDIGVPTVEGTASDSELMLRVIGKRLDQLEVTGTLFREAAGGTATSCIWGDAQKIIKAPENSQVAVSPRKKASAALIAADMGHFSALDAGTRTRLAFTRWRGCRSGKAMRRTRAQRPDDTERILHNLGHRLERRPLSGR